MLSNFYCFLTCHLSDWRNDLEAVSSPPFLPGSDNILSSTCVHGHKPCFFLFNHLILKRQLAQISSWQLKHMKSSVRSLLKDLTAHFQ